MKDWSDKKLIESTLALVDEERRISLEIIRHLQEISQRRLYAERGYANMWTFMTVFLKYSESAAQKRIAVMRLLKVAPQLEGPLESGRLSFSTAAEIASVSKQLKRDPKDLLPLVLDKTCREAKSALWSELPAKAFREKLRELPGGFWEIRLILEEQERNLLESIRQNQAHRNPQFSISKLFREWLEKQTQGLTQVSLATSKVTNPYSPRVPKRVRQQIWQRDGGRCTYEDPLSGRRCDSRSFLELDPIQPRARGGRNEPDNLRLLCREHNLLAATQAFGPAIIESHRNKNATDYFNR